MPPKRTRNSKEPKTQAKTSNSAQAKASKPEVAEDVDDEVEDAPEDEEDDDDTANDDLQYIVQTVMSKNVRKREKRRKAQENDLRKSANELKREVEQTYAARTTEMKAQLRTKLSQLKDLLEKRLEYEKRITAQLDILEKATKDMNSEMQMVIAGRREDLAKIEMPQAATRTTDKEQPAKEGAEAGTLLQELQRHAARKDKRGEEA